MERGEELILIDKHAAHERMLYEKLRTGGRENSSQMLLAPVPVTLDKDSYAAAIEAADLFAKAGFEIDDFGSGTVLVRSAPLWIDGGDVASAVMEMAGYLESSRADLTTDRLDWLYHNVACRAAVKAGDESSPQELMDLVRRLEEESQHPVLSAREAGVDHYEEEGSGKTVWKDTVTGRMKKSRCWRL